ncbi:MAG: hypothetical protein Q7Q71_03005 [Verrucomicrobiota bacterium JB023]|nr:hypothetical protein [Verrucomicrobiota bacterium JB023]
MRHKFQIRRHRQYKRQLPSDQQDNQTLSPAPRSSCAERKIKLTVMVSTTMTLQAQPYPNQLPFENAETNPDPP